MIIQKIKALRSLNHIYVLLIIEAFFILAWARVIKALPFELVTKKLDLKLTETSYEHTVQEKQISQLVSDAIGAASNYTWWESMCLVQAYAAMNMLSRRGVATTIYLGMGKDQKGQLLAHAWLRSGELIVTGKEGMFNFTIVGRFAKNTKTKIVGMHNGN